MSVYVSQRSESKMEFIHVAQQLATYTLEQVKKFPKSRTFRFVDKITDYALEIHECVCRANSYYLYNGMSEDDFRQRERYLGEARSAIFAMSSLLTITFSFVLKGNNFLEDKARMSSMFKQWAGLLNHEAALVKGVVESDKKRYKRYQSAKSKTRTKETKQSESDNEKESEVILPEELFNVVEEK